MLDRELPSESTWKTELSGDVPAAVWPELDARSDDGTIASARTEMRSGTVVKLMRATGFSREAIGIAAVAALQARYGAAAALVGRRNAAGYGIAAIDVSSDPSFAAIVSRVAGTLAGIEAIGAPSFSAIFAAADREAVTIAAYVEETDDVEGAALVVSFADDTVVCASRRLGPLSTAAVCRHLARLVAAAASAPASPVSQLRYLDDAERERAIDQWNATDAAFPHDATLAELFFDAAARRPEAIAIVEDSGELTYAALRARVERYADDLRDRGLGAGSLVGVCLDRSSDLLAAILGILAAGAAYVPLDPAYPRERLRAILDDAGVALVLTQQRHASLVASAPALLIDEPQTGVRPAAAAPARASAGDLAYIIYTSGSTGRPKGVSIEHRSVVAFVTWCARAFLPDDLAGVLFSTSICFDVSVFEVFAPLCSGGTLIVADDLLSVGTLRARDRVRIVSSTTAGLAEVVRMGGLPAGVTTILQAGEMLPRAIADEIFVTTAIRTLHNLCGATEDTVYSTISTVPRDGSDDPAIGVPFDNRKAYVLDRTLEPVPDGIPGELYYAGAGVAREYHRRPDLTAQRFVENPYSRGKWDGRLYRSGDLVRRRADGELVYLGRLDQQVKIRGFRIEPGEIESVIASHPNVFEAAVVVRDNERGEAELAAYIVPRGEPPTYAQIREYAAARLPHYMIPAALVSLKAMPRSPAGKLDRKALPAPSRMIGAGSRPHTRTQATLQIVWRELLGIDDIGIDDNFFVLGGHSLLAARMIARVEAIFLRTELMAPFVASPTIRTLAERINDEHSPVKLSSIVKITAPAPGAPPLFFLHGMFNGDGFYVWNVAKHLPKSFGLYAVHPYGNDGTTPPPTIEAMASEHIREMREIQPHGPYRLGGFCNGGLIAYEMAVQLRAAGERVEHLVVVAANALNVRTRGVREAIRAAARVVPIAPARQTLLYERTVGYTQKLGDLVYDPFDRRWRSPIEMMVAARTLQRIRRRRLALDGIGTGRYDRLYEMAVSEYFPSPYDGEVLVVVGQSSSVEGSEEPTLGWSAIAPNVRVERIPGGHHAVEEHPENFAALLAQWM